MKRGARSNKRVTTQELGLVQPNTASSLPYTSSETPSLRLVRPQFPLPDPSGALRYAWSRQPGVVASWEQIAIDESKAAQWNITIKNHLPRVSFWNTGCNQVILCADFDKVPNGYRDYDELENRMVAFYKDSALVLRSFSGKVKVLFIAEKEENVRMSNKIALDNLRRLLPPNIDEKDIDPSTGALQWTFVSQGIKERMQQLPRLKVHTLIAPAQNIEITPKETPKSEAPLREHAGEIPDDLLLFLKEEKFLMNGTSDRERFVRILLASPQLMYDNGFGISALKIKKQGIASHTTIYKLVSKLVKLGLLKKVSGYIIKKKANCYIANGILREAIANLPPPLNYRKLPKTILDGEWYSTLWYASYKFRYKLEEDFIKWVKTIEEWDRKGKDRLQLAKNAIKMRHHYLRNEK